MELASSSNLNSLPLGDSEIQSRFEEVADIIRSLEEDGIFDVDAILLILGNNPFILEHGVCVVALDTCVNFESLLSKLPALVFDCCSSASEQPLSGIIFIARTGTGPDFRLESEGFIYDEEFENKFLTLFNEYVQALPLQDTANSTSWDDVLGFKQLTNMDYSYASDLPAPISPTPI